MAKKIINRKIIMLLIIIIPTIYFVRIKEETKKTSLLTRRIKTGLLILYRRSIISILKKVMTRRQKML